MKLIVKNLLFTILIPGTVAIYVPLLIAHRPLTGLPGLWLVLGWLLLAVGGMIYFWTVWDFMLTGKGTPLPIQAPRRLVVRGLYHYLRNPMYLGVLLVILGWSVLFMDGGLVIYTVGVGAAFHLFVIFYEEPKLRVLFGADYEKYCAEVSRWLPHIKNRTD